MTDTTTIKLDLESDCINVVIPQEKIIYHFNQIIEQQISLNPDGHFYVNCPDVLLQNLRNSVGQAIAVMYIHDIPDHILSIELCGRDLDPKLLSDHLSERQQAELVREFLCKHEYNDLTQELTDVIEEIYSTFFGQTNVAGTTLLEKAMEHATLSDILELCANSYSTSEILQELSTLV